VLGSILIGLDPAGHGNALVELGIRWGRRDGTTLVGVGIVDEPGIRAIEPYRAVGGTPGVDPIYYEGQDTRLARVNREVEVHLQGFAARCEEAGLPHVEKKLTGTPDELIDQEAQCCDLIVLSRRSRFRFTAREDAEDETFRTVLKNTPRPIVATPAGRFPEGPIVIAYDGSLQAARALAAFAATGLVDSTAVHIVSVDVEAASAARHAERARQFLAYHKIPAIPVTLESSAATGKVIQDLARRVGAGLLVMGAYGQPLLREFFLGSVTRTVLDECPIPVFLFH
jgi:nucleotide-binding universal stress UspA family protein